MFLLGSAATAVWATHQWLNDLAAAWLLAPGKTKARPGFDRLTGFVALTADLSARVRRCPGEPWLRSLGARTGTLQDGRVR